MRAGALLAALLLLPLAGRASEPAATLTVELAPTAITVGDPVAVTATLRLPPGEVPGAAATLEGLTEDWGEATLLAPPALDPPAGGGPLVWRFTLTAFRPGRIELPPLGVRLAGDPPRRVAGGGAVLEVRSVLPPDGDEIGPMPAAAPRPLPGGAAFLVTAGLLAAAIGAAALALARRAAGAPGSDAPRLAPRPELTAALAALADADPVGGHAALSRALRRYLARTFDFPALESTTAQIGRRLTRVPGAAPDPDLVRATVRLLGECDGVKFARRPTDAGALAARSAAAVELADAIESGLAPPEPEQKA